MRERVRLYSLLLLLLAWAFVLYTENPPLPPYVLD